MVRMYSVKQEGVAEYDATTLTECLAYIGRKIIGNRLGCMMVTVKQAIEAGYSITTW